MRFAVIEYSSKSGGVWRHTPDKPNYLADPEKEIDPTSFGCYVSALEGEHIPITWLATSPNPHPSPLPIQGEGITVRGGEVIRKIHKRLLGSWPNYSIDYLQQFDVLMIVHQVSDGHEIARLIKNIRQKFPHVFIIGVPTWPWGQLTEHFAKFPQDLEVFREYMNSCNIFLTVVKETLPWYQERTKTPVVYLPQIYPVEYASQFYKPRVDREKIIFVAGVTQRPNVAQGQEIAIRLQKEFPDYIIHVTSIPGVDLDTSALIGARFEVKDFQQWREHLQYLKKVMLVINTDYTATRGRVQVDCAAVGTPAVGGNSDGQRDLFPELVSTLDTPADQILASARRLLNDPVYYDSVTKQARDRLQKYSYIESADRLQLLVKTYST